MNTKSALILSAGFGTRMGVIGEFYPKVIWPLFHHSILYYQLCYLEELGIENIFINVHHLADQIIAHVDKIKVHFPKLKILILAEEDILDSGGGIHNCLRHIKEDYLLVINGDAFYFSDLVNNVLPKKNNILFAIRVKADDAYNRLVIRNGVLNDILPPTPTAPLVTFSGVSLLYVPAIKPVEGKSRFFETVANFRTSEVSVLFDPNYNYVDLGTKVLYGKFYLDYSWSKHFGPLVYKFFKRNAEQAEVVNSDKLNVAYYWINEYLSYAISINGKVFTSLRQLPENLEDNMLVIGDHRDLII